MQIDDTLMQKNLSARLALSNKKYFISIQSEVRDGNIFLSGKVDEPEEKIKIMNEAGIIVAKSPADIGKTLLEKLSL